MTVKPFLFASLCCLTLPFAARAAVQADDAPVTASPVGASPAESRFVPATLFDARSVSERTLPDGVRGIVFSTRTQGGGSGVVSVQVWVRAGSRFETAKTAGAASVLEDACLRASQSYAASSGPAGQGGARGALEGLGAQVTSQTSRDATFYSATLGAGFYPSALRALADAVLRPALTDSAIAAAKADAANQASGRGGDPLSLASDEAYNVAFARHPYKRPAGGTTRSVVALSAAAARGFYKARYTGADISVVVAGDVDAQQAHALIARAFAGARPATANPTIAPEAAPRAAKTVTLRLPLRASTVALAWGSPGIGAPGDVVAMDVLLSHWKEGSDAALRVPLLGPNSADAEVPTPDSPATPAAPVVPDAPATPDAPSDAPADDALALAYDVDFLTQRDPGLLVVTLITPVATRQAATQALLEEVARARREGLSPAQLSRAKAALRRQYLAGSETPSGAAGALGFYDMIADYRFAVTYLDRAERVTSADVRRVAEKYLSPSKYVQVIIEPPALSPQTPATPPGVITAALPR